MQGTVDRSGTQHAHLAEEVNGTGAVTHGRIFRSWKVCRLPSILNEPPVPVPGEFEFAVELLDLLWMRMLHDAIKVDGEGDGDGDGDEHGRDGPRMALHEERWTDASMAAMRCDGTECGAMDGWQGTDVGARDSEPLTGSARWQPQRYSEGWTICWISTGQRAAAHPRAAAGHTMLPLLLLLPLRVWGDSRARSVGAAAAGWRPITTSTTAMAAASMAAYGEQHPQLLC